jgi:hypothetical protein
MFMQMTIHPAVGNAENSSGTTALSILSVANTYVSVKVGRGTELQAGKSRFRFPMGLLEISIDLMLPAALRSGVRLCL